MAPIASEARTCRVSLPYFHEAATRQGELRKGNFSRPLNIDSEIIHHVPNLEGLKFHPKVAASHLQSLNDGPVEMDIMPDGLHTLV